MAGFELGIDYSIFSDKSLKETHCSLRKAYREDQSLNAEEAAKAKKSTSLTYHDTDTEQDWPLHVSAVESEMARRGLSFTPIETSRLNHLP